LQTIPNDSPVRSRRLKGAGRRLQVLKTAGEQFALTGLHGTTTLALAKAAGISEPILFCHFENKDALFKEAVQANIAARLSALDALASVPHGSLLACVERMAEVSVTVCLSERGHAVLTAWALLELPEYAADLYRDELGAVRMLWERQIAERYPDSPARVYLSIHVVPYVVNACLSFGFWLAALRHTPATASEQARAYAAGIAHAAAALLAEGDCPTTSTQVTPLRPAPCTRSQDYSDGRDGG
jgi:AcrR family transcriptional regulator